jgi:hypothetical protein
MNCLCSTCRLTLISGGLSATRKLWQKSQWVLVNAVIVQVQFFLYISARLIGVYAFQYNRCSAVAVSRAMRIKDTISRTTETKIKATRT